MAYIYKCSRCSLVAVYLGIARRRAGDYYEREQEYAAKCVCSNGSRHFTFGLFSSRADTQTIVVPSSTYSTVPSNLF